MARVIQISGKKRHGKSTVAMLLKDKLGAEIINYADPMKQIMATTLGISLEELDIRKNNDGNYREMLQRLGSEAIKPVFGDSVWAELANKHIDALPVDAYVLMADWRFNSEVREDSFKLRVNRASVPSTHDTHPSEVELDTYTNFTYTLENPEDFNGLISEVDKLVLAIKEHFEPVAVA